MDKQYFLVVDGKQRGPFLLDELKAEKELLQKAEYVWTKGMPEWVRPQEVIEIAALISIFEVEDVHTPPPIPKSNDTPPRFYAKENAREERNRANHTDHKSAWSSFMQAITTDYFDFKGKTNKQDFFGFFCFWLLFVIVFANMFSPVLRLNFSDWTWNSHDFLFDTFNFQNIFYGGFRKLMAIFMLLPFLSISVRRLRDADYSWAYMFLLLVPVFGWIILLVLLFQESK